MGHSRERVESLTQQLGGRLFSLTGDYRPMVRERWQDRLLEQMSEDGVLRSRLLRFIDTHAAVDQYHHSAQVKSLFQE